MIFISTILGSDEIILSQVATFCPVSRVMEMQYVMLEVWKFWLLHPVPFVNIAYVSEFHVTVGTYIPSCDNEGYYEPMQCHGTTGMCWCVNKHGVEFPNSRSHGKVDCGKCVIQVTFFGRGVLDIGANFRNLIDCMYVPNEYVLQSFQKSIKRIHFQKYFWAVNFSSFENLNFF